MCTVFIVFRHTHCALINIGKWSFYAGIMLNALANLLCSKLCRHNWCKPSYKTVFFLRSPTMFGAMHVLLKYCTCTLKNKVCITHKNVLHDTILVSSSTFLCAMHTLFSWAVLNGRFRLLKYNARGELSIFEHYDFWTAAMHHVRIKNPITMK